MKEESICDYCRMTDYGMCEVNTAPYNLCEGMCCNEAAEEYEACTGKKWEGDNG